MTKPQTRRIRRRNSMNAVVYELNGREIPKAEGQVIALEACRSIRQRQEERLNRRVKRLSHCPERTSVAKAMFAVEQRLVEALWTLARLPNDKVIGFASRNGVGYLDERADLYANAVANGGWLTVPPRPAPPSARAIDAMYEPLEWLRHLERAQAKLLTEGAMSRRGDMANLIKWSRIRKKMEMEHLSIRTLQRRYDQAIRDIVTHLTEARIA